MSYQELTDEQVAYADDLWLDGLAVKEEFMNEVPHVMGEKVVKPSCASTEGWALV